MAPRAFSVLTLFTALLYASVYCDQALKNRHFLKNQDVEHIKHDIKDQYYVDLSDKANQDELDVYNFRLHDYDNNYLLDGLELLYALNHSAELPAEQEAQKTEEEKKKHWESKYDSDAVVIDTILGDYDKDQDGFISFAEYMEVRKKYST